VRKWSAVRTPEDQLTVGLSFYLVAFLVHGTVVSPTEHCEIRQRGEPAIRPVLDVVSLTERSATAGKATAFVPMVKRPPKRRRDRPRPGADLDDPPLSVVPYHHAAGVAGQTLGRSRRNARAAFEH